VGTMTNLILCGGNGTRLWPISRTLMPKQFVKLFNKKSLFQLTVERNSKLCESQFIVSNSEQYFLALDQLEEMIEKDIKVSFDSSNINKKNSKYLLEPIGRNTAPAIALACMALDKEEIVLVTPSDHLIKNEIEYKKAINQAKEFANDEKLVTFGITPTFAETGYGYIESENKYDVKAFHEKPDINVATQYLKAGNYYWNSGMFMFKAGVFLNELKRYSPKIYETCKIAFDNKKDQNSILRIQHSHMEAIPSDSIDYAVMEKSNLVKVIPSDISWSDVGSFDSLYDELPKDENNNTINDNHICIDSINNLIYGNDRKIATVDMEDCIIVDTGDAILISKKGSSQKVKQVVQKLKEQKSELHNIHLTGHRPWGTYTILEDRLGYKIKKIEVKSGCRLSLQKHFHRNEHWIVVSGCATVTIEDKTFILNPNESTYIKAGQLHRLENQGKLPLVIIEAQVGEYTGEDDIVRIDDDFSRN
jgi:mannose-1-phosphate guanylyltransferase